MKPVIERLYREIAGDFEPDLTLLLDMPAEASMARVKSRGGWDNRYDLKATPFHRKLRKSFLLLAKKYSKRMKTINAGEGIDTVARDVAKAVARQFKLKAKA
jgi:dTMP kinase